MKKLVLGLILLVSQMASATSIRIVKLQQIEQPFTFGSHSPIAGLTTYVQVMADGAVVGSQCRAKAKCKSIEFDRVSSRELARIDRLTKRAAKVALTDPNPGGIHCLAMPDRTVTYKAGIEQLVLKSATSPCGGVMVRDSAAAEELVEMLDGFRAAYDKLIGE